MKTEKRKFDAEIGKVLHLMIHSLYSDKEIFMRELISNASDACDKLRYLSQTDNNLLEEDKDFKINISIDKENKTILIRDNGIGMNNTDLSENLGTIAKSGTQNFLTKLSGDKKKDSQLIGQFGVGFYSAFMVADKVTITSRKAGEANSYSWESDGKGEYSISDADSGFSRGTEVRLHIKEDASDYLDHFRIKHIIKNYSDHIDFPIFFKNESDKEEQVNSASALWIRNKSDISEEKYEEFYKNISYDTNKPWLTLHNKNEGVVEFTNLLFIPSSKTFDLFHPDRKCRVKLYIKKVFIADEGINLIPQYMRFLRGVIDSQDLPLNISRQTLQNNAIVEKINKSITNRILSELKKQKENNFEEYLSFWSNFGGALKEGLCEPNNDHQKILETCLFKSVLHDKMITLDEYIKNSQEKTIYYLSGDNPEKLRNNPQIEGFIKKNIDVLLFTDPVDDFWVNVNNTYKEVDIKSVTRSDIALDKNKDIDNSKEQDELIKYFKKSLGDIVKDVKISKRLTLTPACLTVNDGSMDIRMERHLIEQKQLSTASAKILEINPKHKSVLSIANAIEKNAVDDTHKELIHLLYDQACIIEGEPVSDVGAFSKRMNNILEKIS